MRVPYMRMAPYLRNLVYDMGATIIPSGAANGTFFIRVVNPLAAPSTTSPVGITVWYRGCENMDFRQPRVSLTNYIPATATNILFRAAITL